MKFVELMRMKKVDLARIILEVEEKGKSLKMWMSTDQAYKKGFTDGYNNCAQKKKGD